MKGNQPKLYQGLLACAAASHSVDVYQHYERGHNRQVHRRTTVYRTLEPWPQQWPGLAAFVVVKRWGVREGEWFCHHQCYISDLSLSAYAFSHLIQGHWSIENQLHWPKDMVLGEDNAPQRAGQAPVNWSTVRNFFINVVRKQGYRSLTKGKRAFANRPKAVLRALQLLTSEDSYPEFSPSV